MAKFTAEVKEHIVQLMVKHDKVFVCGKELTLKELYKMKSINRLNLFSQMYNKLWNKFDATNVSVTNFDCCLKAYIDMQDEGK